MTSFHNVLVSSGLVFAFFSGPVEAQQNTRTAGQMVTLQMPAIPDPARVTLDPKTTALIVLDYVEPNLQRPAELQGQDAAGDDPFYGLGAQGRPHRGLRHS